MNWIDYILAALIALPILATFVLGAFLARNGKHAMGRPTIQPLFFYSGKFLLFGVWALFGFISFFPEYRNVIPFFNSGSDPGCSKVACCNFFWFRPTLLLFRLIFQWD